ncbi:GLPGLI family protein [Aquimarina megaterium]|uniref:GLPGLI family protein n=1 Tax=Aquimarina megaterium TaxID=1443666 RepID=UPI000941E1A7|nr:GLPGLI family protein [Aquimarina megaterium]
MKRLLYILIISIVLSSVTMAQDNEIVGSAEYHYVINNERGVSFSMPYRLYFTKDIAMYEKTGDAKLIKDSRPKTEMRGGVRIITKIRVLQSNVQPYYYTNLITNDLIFRETISSKLYTIKDSVKTIPWKLHSEYKNISKYKCQKATALFRGRKYTAWFTTEIPVSHGPWKLRGLPGLIMKAYDHTRKYEFEIAKVNLNADPKMIQEKTSVPTPKKIQEMKVYIDAIKNEQKNTLARARATLPRGARLEEECEDCPKAQQRNIEIFN